MLEKLRHGSRLLAVLAAAGLVVILVALVLSSPIAVVTPASPVADGELPTLADPEGTTSPTPLPGGDPDPGDAAPLSDDVQLPPSAPTHWAEPAGDPGILSLEAAPASSCADDPLGRTSYLPVTWRAYDGNTVDVYYALTDTAELATDGFIPIGAGLTAAGTLRVPRPCPQGDGPLPFVTVKVVANGATASLSAYYWGL